MAVSQAGNRFTYTGREWISEIGLMDYRNRFYSTDLGRFLQADPIRFSGKDVNLYRYAKNSPIKLIDAYGLCPDNPVSLTADELGVIGSQHATDLGNNNGGVEYCGLICEKCQNGQMIRMRTPPVTIKFLINVCQIIHHAPRDGIG